MKKILASLTFLISFTVFYSGLSQAEEPDNSGSIVGGSPVDISNYSYQVYLDIGIGDEYL